MTADGAGFFASLAENQELGAINHYTFGAVETTTLLPLLSEFADGAGRIIAIGGTTVRFPQITFTGPTTGEVGVDATYTLVAADADGVPLSANSFDSEVVHLPDRRSPPPGPRFPARRRSPQPSTSSVRRDQCWSRGMLPPTTAARRSPTMRCSAPSMAPPGPP